MLESVRALLEGLIDYAGLFPPAGLPMTDAVAEYGRHLSGEHGWMLGRFIVPVARLSELETVLANDRRERNWRISVLTGSDVRFDIPAVLAFNAHVRGATADSLESKGGIADVAGLPGAFTVYFELPPEPDPGSSLESIRAAGGRAKIRTGGVEEAAFPRVQHVARFIRRCAQKRVAFKATAGLHHPVPGVHPLSDERGSATYRMHGFLNVAVAAAFACAGMEENDIRRLLDHSAPEWSFSDDGLRYGGDSLNTAQIREARSRLFTSFGSCSFSEPVADLKSMGRL